jgi:hypothetical protein
MSLWQRPNGPQSIAANSAAQSALNSQASLAALIPAVLVLPGTTETVVPNPQNSTIALILPITANQGLEQIPWDLVVSGFITTTNSSNITCKIYSGTSLTVGSDTAVATSGAIAVNTVSAPFFMRLYVIYDSVSGKLQGSFEGMINNVLVAKTALSNVVTGIKDTNNPVLSFVVSFTSSAATALLPATITVKNFTAG